MVNVYGRIVVGWGYLEVKRAGILLEVKESDVRGIMNPALIIEKAVRFWY